MAQFLRPDGDTALGGWSNPSFSVIDESIRNDSDETTTGNNPDSDTLEVSTSDVSSPEAGTRTFRYTYKKTGTRQENITVELREGSTVIETNTHVDIGTSYVQNNHTVTGSITDYTNVNFRFIANAIGGGSPSTVQVSWAEFEIPDEAEATPLTLDLSDDMDNLVDSLSFALAGNLTQSAGDSINNLVDAFDKLLDYRLILADNALALADSEIVTLGYEIPDGDSLDNLSDSLLKQYEYILRPTENLDNLSDSISKVLSYETDFGDNLDNLLDSVSKILGYNILFVDILTQTDSISKRLGYLVIKADTINNLLDILVLQRLHQYEISVGDLCLFTDSLDGVELLAPTDDEQQIVIGLLI